MTKLFLLMIACAAMVAAHAQSLTINNTTGCGVSFSVSASDPGMCNPSYTSTGSTMLAAGSSVTYNNTTPFSWNTPPPVNASWLGIIILDDGQLKFTEVDALCTGLPQVGTYTSPCTGSSVTVTWTDNGGGSATVDIR